MHAHEPPTGRTAELGASPRSLTAEHTFCQVSRAAGEPCCSARYRCARGGVSFVSSLSRAGWPVRRPLRHSGQQAPREHLLFVVFSPRNSPPLDPGPSCLLWWCLVSQALCHTGSDRRPMRECRAGSSLPRFEAPTVTVVAGPSGTREHPRWSPSPRPPCKHTSGRPVLLRRWLGPQRDLPLDDQSVCVHMCTDAVCPCLLGPLLRHSSAQGACRGCAVGER